MERPMGRISKNAKHFHVIIPDTAVTGEWIVALTEPFPSKDFPPGTPKHNRYGSYPPLVMHRIAQGSPVILYLHGGGYIGLSTMTHRSWMSKIATRAQAVVLGINYRLAPEHPFPLGLLDALRTYRWLVAAKEEGGLGIPSSRIAVGGDSAGGGLSLALVLSILHGTSHPLYSPNTYYKYKTHEGPVPVVEEGVNKGEGANTKPIDPLLLAQAEFDEDAHMPFDLSRLSPPGLVILISPWADVECKTPSWDENAQYCYLAAEPIVGAWYAGHHLLELEEKENGGSTDRERIPLSHPLLSPVHAEFDFFPPTLIQVGAKETLYDDVVALSQRIEKANGTEVTLEVYEDMVHAFQLMGRLTPAVDSALESIALAVRKMMAGPRTKTPTPAALAVEEEKQSTEQQQAASEEGVVERVAKL